MKRFVLLSDPASPRPGKRRRATHRELRDTIRALAEIQIGGADIRDAIAFLPVDLREASDPDTGAAHHVLSEWFAKMANGRFCPSAFSCWTAFLEVEWDQAEIATKRATSSRVAEKIAAAIETYRKSYARLPESLTSLAHRERARQRRTALAVGRRSSGGQENGYSFRYVIVGANDVGAPAQYELSATVIYGRTGKVSYFRDSSGTTHAGDHQGAIGNATIQSE